MSFQRFRLVPMHEEKDPEKDDWSGLSDAKERRKRQNRLNQRTARRRQRLKEAEAEDDSIYAGSGSDAGNSARNGAALNGAANPMIPQADTALYFPITPDHRLLHVVAVNVSRAVLTNYFIITSIAPSSSDCCSGRRVLELECPVDSMACPDPYRDGSVSQIPFPPSLVPTKLQQSIPHAGWVDLFPSPQLRDNLILAMEEFSIDADELMDDLTGSLFDDLACSVGCDPKDLPPQLDDANDPLLAIEQEPFEEAREDSPSSEKRASSGEIGIVSWSDPWDISGWEVTDRFVAKWGFLLQGCPDVVAAANNWRDLRGEEPLVVEL
ncbi:hypothetical protein PT974_09375 [Cladobotryum mycophilum]|uniref:BZIP domain-containing protein n=1 Tax=Cladobotryum mycophilum TaxID=491253 RepID=A0ABR0SGZ4_9HYPO